MDAYPVTITFPDGQQLQRCKARIDGDGVTVWQWDRDARAGVVVYQSPEVEQEPHKRWRSGDVTLAQVGCGSCSNPLKRWRPPGGHAAVAG